MIYSYWTSDGNKLKELNVGVRVLLFLHLHTLMVLKLSCCCQPGSWTPPLTWQTAAITHSRGAERDRRKGRRPWRRKEDGAGGRRRGHQGGRRGSVKMLKVSVGADGQSWQLHVEEKKYSIDCKETTWTVEINPATKHMLQSFLFTWCQPDVFSGAFYCSDGSCLEARQLFLLNFFFVSDVLINS